MSLKGCGNIDGLLKSSISALKIKVESFLCVKSFNFFFSNAEVWSNLMHRATFQ